MFFFLNTVYILWVCVTTSRKLNFEFWPLRHMGEITDRDLCACVFTAASGTTPS